MTRALLLQLATCLFMTGLIWFVQIVHYPLFDRVPQDRFAEFALQHQRRTTWVVMPVMLIELVSAVWLFASPPASIRTWENVLAVGLLAIVWASTAWLQVPDHGQLASGFRGEVHRHLVATNWVRTVAWTLRSLVLLLVAARALESPPPAP